MRPIPDKTYLDFSGGLRLDKSPYTLEDNEVQKAINVNFDDTGRIEKREGYIPMGSTLAFAPSTIRCWVESDSSVYQLLMEERDASANFYKLIGSPLNGAITSATTTIVVDDGTNFANSGTIEIEGDIITYTGKTGSNLTGVTGISKSHATDSFTRQWKSLTTFPALASPASTAILNNIFFVSGGGFMRSWDATDIATPKNVSIVTNYRKKLYGCDSNNSVFYSNADDGTTWTTASDFFYIAKNDKRYITAINVVGNYLGFWKEDELWTWDNYYLRQRSKFIGAWNDKSVKEVNSLTYFFGARGIYVTNGTDISQISKPVKKYIDDYTPTYTTARVMDTASGFYENKFITHIGNISTEDTITDANLVYDTANKNWTVWSDLDADGICFDFNEKYVTVTGSGKYVDERKYYFGGAGKQLYQFGGVYHDNWSDISAEVIFKPFHLDLPQRKKHFGEVKVFSETTGFNLFYKIDDEVNWHSLGLVQKKIQKFLINKKGYKITLKLTESSQKKSFVLNGFVFEKCHALTD